MFRPHPELIRQHKLLMFSGLVLATALLCGVLGLVGTLVFAGTSSNDIAISRIIHTLASATLQAVLSALCSLLIGCLGAYALFHRPQWPGRRILLGFGFIAMILPTTVAALALVSIWGRQGIIRNGLEAVAGVDILFDAYGLEMVVLAHVFFNAPLVMRVALGCFQAIPAHQIKLASHLNFSRLSRARWLEWPAVRAVLPSLFGLIFLLCFSSFSLVLMLGGGPAVTTLEVAIYTSIKFEFDLPAAGILALIQLGVSSIFIVCLSFLPQVSWTTHIRPDHHVITPDNWGARILDVLGIGMMWVLCVLPVMMLIIKTDLSSGWGLFHSADFWQATMASLTLGVSAAVVSTLFALWLSAARYRVSSVPFLCRLHAVFSLSVSVYLVMPSVVLGTASFIWLRGWIDMFSSAFWLVLAANVTLGLPFAARILAGRYEIVAYRTDRLCQMLNITGLRRFWLITVPALRHELGLALGLTAALSFGDFGVIALFGSDSFRTLPLLLYQYSARYGAPEADMLALVMLGLALVLYGGFYGACRWAGHHADRPLSLHR